jgi:hypothetical protein
MGGDPGGDPARRDSVKARMTVWTKALAAASGSLLICCSAAGPEADAPPSATVQSGTVDAPPPPAPPSPLPSGFNFPGSGDSTSPAPAPSPSPSPAPGTGRVIWATAGNRLLELTSDASTKVDAYDVAGLAPGEQLVGLDFRKNGTLYAVGTTSRLFSIAPKTATATAISFAPFAEPLDGTAFGFGFDPVSDLARVTSNTSENIRIEAETGTVTNVDDSLHYGAGDANVNAVPRVSAVAYAADGVGYALDAQTGSLARLVDSYSGELQTIGALGVAVTDIGGFDIAGKDAFAALRVGSVTSLYAVDLATGKVASMGQIGDGGPVTGLAIQP